MGDLGARGTWNQYRKFREAKVSSAHRATAQGEEVLASGLEPSRPSRRGLGLYASVGTRVLTAEALGIVVWDSLCKGLIWHKACLKILGLVVLLAGPGSVLGLAMIICQGHSHEDRPSNGPVDPSLQLFHAPPCQYWRNPGCHLQPQHPSECFCSTTGTPGHHPRPRHQHPPRPLASSAKLSATHKAFCWVPFTLEPRWMSSLTGGPFAPTPVQESRSCFLLLSPCSLNPSPTSLFYVPWTH